MDIQSISLVSVSYNSAELVDDLLGSFRKHYRNPITIIDGSSAEHVPAIAAVCAKYLDVKFIHFDYNIHHGPGMAWAYQHLDLRGPVLVLDSDVLVVNPGLVEALAAELKPGMYGVGYVNHVNEGGFDVDYTAGAVRYLHPACMLCNIEVVRQWPMPTKHGAPNIEPMLAIHRAGKHELIAGIPWVKDDFAPTFQPKHYLRHDWQGTVVRTGGYHLEEWQRSVIQKQSTPPALVDGLADADLDLLRLIPVHTRAVVDVGSKSDALARAYKSVNPSCHYEVVSQRDIESVDESFYADHAHCDVWILNEVLARMRNPWRVLSRIRSCLPAGGCVVVCLPNAQHWSVLAKLCVGDFRYEDAGLMARGNLRFFTRATMLEMFVRAGFKMEQGFPRIHSDLKNESVATAIKSMAIAVGAEPDLALQDSLPMQFVVKLVCA
ncbi:MAG: methyltransferase domain-containing protein [Pseudomonadota bacterium]